jgi:hypothetical protein
MLVGFSRSFYLRSYFGFPDLPVHLYVHGIVLTAWFSIACVQPWLLERKRPDVHRRLGIAGIATAVGVVLTGIWTLVMRDVAELDQNPSRDAGNIASLIMFSFCVGFGMVFRRNRAMHKRLMLIASIPILAPALDRAARIPPLKDFFAESLSWYPASPEIAFATLSFLLLLAVVVVNDLLSEGWVHRGTAVGLASVFVLTPLVTFLLFFSGLWVQFVHWVV